MVSTSYGCIRGGANLFRARLPHQFLEPVKFFGLVRFWFAGARYSKHSVTSFRSSLLFVSSNARAHR